mmetsp:Transcript_14592/g.22523  ORF Transcript_14592/g.22523 Transcript_14592/m.22523 type:complete len:88 (+) Transcript_14592:23-286(+)
MTDVIDTPTKYKAINGRTNKLANEGKYDYMNQQLVIIPVLIEISSNVICSMSLTQSHYRVMMSYFFPKTSCSSSYPTVDRNTDQNLL